MTTARTALHATLVRLGFLSPDRGGRWVLTRRAALSLAMRPRGHAALEQATTHLIDLNQASGESVSLSTGRPDMVLSPVFPSLNVLHYIRRAASADVLHASGPPTWRPCGALRCACGRRSCALTG